MSKLICLLCGHVEEMTYKEYVEYVKQYEKRKCPICKQSMELTNGLFKE